MIWVQIGQLATTIVIGIIAALIAWRQWRTARDKIKLDLFDRRFAVFMDIRKIVSESGQIIRLSDPGLPNEIYNRCQFLFGPEIQSEIKRFHDIAVRIQMNEDSARSEMDQWFKAFVPKMKAYMHFGDIKS